MGTHKITVNSYNQNPESWYNHKLKSFGHSHLEKPAMYSLLPELKTKDVLCIGCGGGEECAHILSLGASRVVGIDLSEKLLEYSKQNCPGGEFYLMDMENLEFPPQDSFDIVYSSLALHYVKDWTKTLRSVHKIIKDDGIFLFSTHHPFYYAAAVNPQLTNPSCHGREISHEISADGIKTYLSADRANTRLFGYSKNCREETCEVYGDYFNIREIHDVWYDHFEVVYYHRPLSSIFTDIWKSDFSVVDFIEPKPIPSLEKDAPILYEIWSRIPVFLIFKLVKRLG